MNGYRSRWLACTIVLLTLATACGRDDARARASGARRDADSAAELAPPPPLPPPIPSRFDAPLEYDFTPVLRVVERVVPQRFGSLDSVRLVNGDPRRRYAFEATRGRFTAFVDDSLVHLRTRISYAARGFYKPRLGPTLSAGCGKGDDRPELDVELVTPLAVDSTWHLRSRVRLVRLAPVSERAEDRCRVSIIRFDVTDRVVDAAQRALDARMSHIDRMVARVDLAERAARWWALLERPIRLRDGVWLELRPQRLRVGRVTGEGRLLTVQTGLDALPRVVVGPVPALVSRPLPPLGRDTSPGGFHIRVDAEVDWPAASQAIAEALRGRAIRKGGRSVVVTSAAASPGPRGTLVLAVGFAGDADGTIRLVGTPRLDVTRTAVVVPDLDYELATDDELVQVVAWVKDDALRDLLRARSRIPVAPAVARGRALLEQGLNRTIGGVMTLSARIDSVTVDGLHVAPHGLVVRAGATGTARVAVRQRSARGPTAGNRRTPAPVPATTRLTSLPTARP